RSMVGVDLSGRMLEQAAGREIYQSLEQGDLLSSLRAHRQGVDLILAADVFVYVGELSGIVAAVMDALRPGGLFAFSVETHEGESFILRPSRRYAYSRPYIEKLAADAGLAVIVADPASQRREGEEDVPGAIYVMRRP